MYGPLPDCKGIGLTKYSLHKCIWPFSWRSFSEGPARADHHHALPAKFGGLAPDVLKHIRLIQCSDRTFPPSLFRYPLLQVRHLVSRIARGNALLPCFVKLCSPKEDPNKLCILDHLKPRPTRAAQLKLDVRKSSFCEHSPKSRGIVSSQTAPHGCAS